MTRGTTLALCLAATLGVHAAAPEVSVEGLEVQIAVEDARLEQVLAELADATGMEVVYDGPPPNLAVTARLSAPTHADAVIRLLDGLALSYALQLDGGGERVTMLWIAEAKSGGRARPRASPGRARRAGPSPPEPQPATEDGEPLPDSDAGPAAPDMNLEPERPPARPRAFPTPLILATPAPTTTPTPPGR